MNVSRKPRLIALIAFATLLAISFATTTANACGYRSYGYPSYYGHGSFYGGSSYVARPISYPVTYYDYFGRPYTVWKTSYSYLSY